MKTFTDPTAVTDTKTFSDMKGGEHFIVITRGMRGWFACEMWINNEDADLGEFPEPWQSDDLSFETEAEAVVWAKQLAEDLDLPYIA